VSAEQEKRIAGRYTCVIGKEEGIKDSIPSCSCPIGDPMPKGRSSSLKPPRLPTKLKIKRESVRENNRRDRGRASEAGGPAEGGKDLSCHDRSRNAENPHNPMTLKTICETATNQLNYYHSPAQLYSSI
jgi:hypothetical protein